MPIPLSQLETWSHQGAITISANTYNSIQTALLKSGSPANVLASEIFLQGSYVNDTNIYGDSDIDVVVLYRGSFHKDLSNLPLQQQQLHELTFFAASYNWANLRDDVTMALKSHFGVNSVIQGKKSIKVKTSAMSKPADVIPALEFRRYAHFNSQNDLSAHWGIVFFDNTGSQIVNYPKYHIERGVEKNKPHRANGQYKKIVRIFKNFRNYMLEKGLILNKDIAPSYFIECALHNVPDSFFLGDFTKTIPAILKYLSEVSFDKLLCQNGVTYLIGDGQTQWHKDNYTNFVISAISAWNNWV